MSKIENQHISIRQQKDENILTTPQNHDLFLQQQTLKNSNIVIFDVEDSQYLSEQKSQQQKIKNLQTQKMSNQEYLNKCLQLKKRIILGNISQSANNALKNHKNFLLADKLKNGKQVKNHESSFKEHFDIKVDFISPQSSAPSQSVNFQTVKQNKNACEYKQIHQNIKNKVIVKQLQLENTLNTHRKKNNQSKNSTVQQLTQQNLIRVSSFRDFLYTQLRPSYQIFILVKCIKNGLISSTYKFYFQQNNKFIMSCERQGLSRYVFSSSQVHIDQSHISYLGKIDSNLTGSQYYIYDAGEDSGRTKTVNSKKQLAYISYSREQNQPIKLLALITNCDNKSSQFTTINKKDNIISNQWAIGNRKDIIRLSNKLPNYDIKECSSKLNFKGIAEVECTKSLILQNSEHPEALIFGRESADTYLMRVKSPFSLIQAFTICMTSIHSKFV